MATVPEIREANEREELLEGFRRSPYQNVLASHEPSAIEGGLAVGPYEILPGQVPSKPVIRDAKTKSLLKGSGRYPRQAPAFPPTALQAVTESATTEYREKADYRAEFERLFPAGGDVSERGSLAWLFDQFWAACEGSPQYVPCPHEDCGKKHLVAFKKEAATMFKMIELGVGKAAQTVNINSREDKLVRVLEQRVVDINIHGLPDDVAQRMQVIEAAGFRLLDEGESDGGLGDAGSSGGNPRPEPETERDSGSSPSEDAPLGG
jgi:hypothetical protein